MAKKGLALAVIGHVYHRSAMKPNIKSNLLTHYALAIYTVPPLK